MSLYHWPGKIMERESEKEQCYVGYHKRKLKAKVIKIMSLTVIHQWLKQARNDYLHRNLICQKE